MLRIIAVTTSLILISFSAHAVNCHKIPSYSEYGNYYQNDLVQRMGDAYECKVGGWCKQAGPYTPGIGWAWEEAWEKIGHCKKGERLSDRYDRKFRMGQYYTVGDKVFHHGEFFECKIDGWCSGGNAYEPGYGRAWQDAWEIVYHL